MAANDSMFSSSVIESLFELNSHSQAPIPVAYCYCSRNPAEPARADPNEILRSILKQLSSTKATSPIRAPLVEAYRKQKDEAEEDGQSPSALTTGECIELILALLEEAPAYILIDALDETVTGRRRSELLQALNRIIQDSFNLVKIFVSSRDDHGIVSHLETSPNVFIRATDNHKDIERFIECELDRALKTGELLWGSISTDLRCQITESLTHGAQGMYVIVRDSNHPLSLT